MLVTATKRGAVAAQDTSASVQAFDELTLDRMGVTDFADFARSVPGLNAIDMGPGQKTYIMRGVSGPGESTVGVYLDNIPLVGSGSDALLAGSNQVDIGVFDVGSVEVLRGPQGTLYGANSIAGVIRYTTNKPDASRFEARTQFDGAYVTDGSPNYMAKGMVNLPLIPDVLAARAVGYYISSGGFVDNVVLGKDSSCYARQLPNPNQPLRDVPELGIRSAPGCLDGSVTGGFRDVNSYTQLGGRLQAKWDISDISRLLF